MAITVNNLPSDNVLINGFNPYFITFETDSDQVATNAFITFTRVGSPNVSTFINITPNNDGLFLFNFQGIYKDVESSASNFTASSFLYPDISTASNALFIDPLLNTKIISEIAIFSGETQIDSLVIPSASEFYFLRGASQVLSTPFSNNYSQSTANPNTNTLILSEGQNVQEFNVWQGFPFDVQYDALDSTNQTVFNGTGLLFSKALSSVSISRTSRLVLIDALGNEITGLNDNSNNSFEVGFTGGTTNEVFFKANYKKVDCIEDSRYIRFVNSKGGDSYWLFTNNYVTQKKRKNKKSVNRNFTDLETAQSRSVSLGSDVTDRLIVSHTTNEDYENEILRSLINSPVIELYQGNNKWLRVELINHNGDDNAKQTSTTFNFTFDLGTIYNQSI